MKTKFLLFATVFTLTIFIGCSSDESSTTEAITSDDVVENSEIDAPLDDISLIVEDQFLVQESSLTAKKSATVKINTPIVSILPVCAIITESPTTDNHVRTIDFGTDGCILPNGNIVKGKITISFPKTTTPSRTISYTLEGFRHNGNVIEGNKTITVELKSTNLLATPHPVTTHSVDAKITFPDGKVCTRTGTTVREMTEGIASIDDRSDNVFLVSGYNITTFPNGVKYTSTITTPLKVKMICGNTFPVSGVVTIMKKDKKATLNFGADECDKLATITIDGVEKAFP